MSGIDSRTIRLCCVLLALLSVGLVTFLRPVFSQSQSQTQPQETIPRLVLEGMARNQYSVLCSSEGFTACMGFSESVCTDLSNEAIKQCLLPLPEEIDLSQLDNSALESCPKQVFADAGYSEEKAAQCFDEVVGGQ